MPEHLIGRLEQHGALTEDEREVLRNATSRVRTFDARQDIIPEGSTRTESALILEGFACRSKHLRDGSRQITAFHVPGDFADLHSFLLTTTDDGVGALTPCKVALVPHKSLREITRQYPYLARVLWLTTLIDGAIHREWMTGIGRLPARERVAHLLCELTVRLQRVGMVNHGSFELPITQSELSDATGLSYVHVNRMLMELRKEGLITSSGTTVTINDWKRLRDLAQFNPEYLHVGRQVERD